MDSTTHKAFSTYVARDTCTWPGTKWEGTGANVRLLPCGEPSVGAGLFCDPDHRHCEIHTVCERHSRNKIEKEW